MMKNFFAEIWAALVNIYGIYSGFIHSILPAQLGDLAEAVLDIAIVCLLVKAIGSIAFGTKTGDN